MTRLFALFAALSLTACATVPRGDVEELKPTIEAFHQRARWKDFRGAADLLVDERRGAFVKERLKLKDDQDLFITNFELEDAKVALDMLSAEVVTKISWYRLPSSTEKTAVVTNVFVWREAAWRLESQDDGPFEDLKPAPVKPAPPAPSPAPAATPAPKSESVGPAGKSKN
jgi:hypothetical protein